MIQSAVAPEKLLIRCQSIVAGFGRGPCSILDSVYKVRSLQKGSEISVMKPTRKFGNLASALR